MITYLPAGHFVILSRQTAYIFIQQDHCDQNLKWQNSDPDSQCSTLGVTHYSPPCYHVIPPNWLGRFGFPSQCRCRNAFLSIDRRLPTIKVTVDRKISGGRQRPPNSIPKRKSSIVFGSIFWVGQQRRIYYISAKEALDLIRSLGCFQCLGLGVVHSW